MRLVVLESPYAGKTPHEIAHNVRYLRACMHDCFKRGDIPFASHGLYTQPGVLRDEDPEERALGIEGGLLWGYLCEAVCIYQDLGVTPGMELGISRHNEEGRKVEMHSLGPDWEDNFPGGLTADEISVFLDKQDDIDEIFAAVSYVHVERLDEGTFMFAIGDQSFLVHLDGDRLQISYNFDASYPWTMDDADHNDLAVDLEGHMARQCPNPDCTGQDDLEFKAAHSIPQGQEQKSYGKVCCKSCGMHGPNVLGGPDEAVSAWNNLPRQINWKVPK